MKNLSKTKKLLIACIILNLLVWVGYAIVFLQIKNQNQKISELVNEAEEDTKKEESLRLIKASLNENKDFISHIDSYFVPKDGVVGLIDYLESLGRQSSTDLTIGSVSVEPDGKNKDDFKEFLRLKIEVIGSWKNVQHFQSLLQNLPYKVDIQQVDFILSETKSGTTPKISSSSLWRGDFEFTLLKLK